MIALQYFFLLTSAIKFNQKRFGKVAFCKITPETHVALCQKEVEIEWNFRSTNDTEIRSNFCFSTLEKTVFFSSSFSLQFRGTSFIIASTAFHLFNLCIFSLCCFVSNIGIFSILSLFIISVCVCVYVWTALFYIWCIHSENPIPEWSETKKK